MRNQDNAPATKRDLKLLATKEELVATNDLIKALATKEDLENYRVASKTENAETRRILSMQIVKNQADLREIKETMSTKNDIERLFNALDKFAGKAQNYDRASVLHGQAITEIQIDLKKHDGRLRRLESGS